MEKEKPFAIDWPSIKSGTMLYMKDFPSIKLLKLDNHKGCYFGFDETENGVLVDVNTYTSELHGDYYYFRVTSEDWHPITSRLWIYD